MTPPSPARRHAAPFLGLLLAAACAQPLEAGLAEGEANAILVALHDRGIGAHKESEAGAETFEVRVAAEDFARGLDVLRAEGLPRRPPEGLREVFGEGGLVPTATEERARYVAALGGELARSLEAIDGVLEARVHLALPERRLLAVDEAPPRPRASVLLRHRGISRRHDSPPVGTRPKNRWRGCTSAQTCSNPRGASPSRCAGPAKCSASGQGSGTVPTNTSPTNPWSSR